MAVQAQYGGLAGWFPRGFEADELEMQMRALQEYGALLSASAAGGGIGAGYDCAAVVSGAEVSELTCNNVGGGGVMASRKRGMEVVDVEQYVSSSAALLPIPGMTKAAAVAAAPTPVRRMVDSAMTSTSGRSAVAVGDALVSELVLQNAEIEALVRMECERMRGALVRAASAAVARRLREKEAELEAARRRAAELEEHLRQATAETQAWCGLARSNEAVALGLRATLDHLLRAAPAQAAEGFGETCPALPVIAPAAADDAQSCCFETNIAPTDDAASSPAGGKWSCKSCVEREATVLLLPCRHLCLCTACEPKLDACPVCLTAKNASVPIDIN
ncbi:hypothetical protein GUJ93_ZPchr0011g26873 [Zizania palustris]|uniref:RING-type domain-containing protein n=1 Tax=Zizania palustris TaxID=103762 RepID=A0A8J6BKU8_ZIZPA|nr:hypothetical protein GUJ93_ZPchr0011g26873 [Zizania palustris]